MSDRKAIRAQARQIAAQVLKVCEEEARNEALSVPLPQFRERASKLTGISTRTLSRIKSEPGKEILKSRKPRSDRIELDDFDKCVLRRTVNEMYGVKKIRPTLDKILVEVREKIEFRGGKTVLARLLQELGFSWAKCSPDRKILMERTDIVNRRITYLRSVFRYRKTGRDIVYVDETYVHSSHHATKCWKSDDVGLNVPIGKGDRYIIVHAGSKEGFIPNAKNVFKANSSKGDYHAEMNGNKFETWLTEQLIPNLKPRSVVVLDNAPYHTVIEEKCPTAANNKAQITEWLRLHSISIPDGNPLKATLLHLCKVNKPEPTFRADTLLRKYGHDVLRLPPYHADLNAIELIWANMKGYVARHNLSFKMIDVKTHIENAIR